MPSVSKHFLHASWMLGAGRDTGGHSPCPHRGSVGAFVWRPCARSCGLMCALRFLLPESSQLVREQGVWSKDNHTAMGRIEDTLPIPRERGTSVAVAGVRGYGERVPNKMTLF